MIDTSFRLEFPHYEIEVEDSPEGGEETHAEPQDVPCESDSLSIRLEQDCDRGDSHSESCREYALATGGKDYPEPKTILEIYHRHTEELHKQTYSH